MKEKDIVGRQIVCFKFPSDSTLHYGNTHERNLGKTGTVKEIHDKQPKYSRVIYEDGNYDYYPTALIVEQLEHEDRPIDDVFKELHKLLKKI